MAGFRSPRNPNEDPFLNASTTAISIGLYLMPRAVLVEPEELDGDPVDDGSPR